MKKENFTNEELQEITMDLVLKRLSEESPHLSNPEHGNGVLEVIYSFNSPPRINDRYSLLKETLGGELKISFPKRDYNLSNLKANIQILYTVVSQYLSTRIVPQGKLTFYFEKGGIKDFAVENNGTYNDLQRTGKAKFDLDDLLFGDEEDEE